MGWIGNAIRHLAWWLDYATRPPGIPAQSLRARPASVVRAVGKIAGGVRVPAASDRAASK